MLIPKAFSLYPTEQKWEYNDSQSQAWKVRVKQRFQDRIPMSIELPK